MASRLQRIVPRVAEIVDVAVLPTVFLTYNGYAEAHHENNLLVMLFLSALWGTAIATNYYLAMSTAYYRGAHDASEAIEKKVNESIANERAKKRQTRKGTKGTK